MKTALFIFLFSFSIIGWTQVKGKITYKVYLDKESLEKPFENPENSPSKNEALAMLHSAQPVESYLIFNDKVSMYYTEGRNETPEWNADDGLISIVPPDHNWTYGMAGGDNLYFTDWTRDFNISTSNVLNTKRRIVKDSLNWKITEETQHINGFLCYKAILTTKENRFAWFTKDLPVSHGPRGFNGLPGLVLYFQNNKYHYRAIKIELDHPDASTIEEPMEGELISEKDFRELSKTIMSGN